MAYSGVLHRKATLGFRYRSQVKKRGIELWTQQPGIFGFLQRWKISWLMGSHGPLEWCFGTESTTGEYTVIFEHP